MSNLRCIFFEEKRRYQRSLTSGDVDSVRQIKWQYFKALTFLNKSSEKTEECNEAENRVCDNLSNTSPSRASPLTVKGPWTIEETHALIDIWRELPLFYEKSLVRDKASKRKRDRHVEIIAQQLGRSEEAVRKKMRNLRSSYLAELRRYEKSLEGGDPSGVKYIHWQYYMALSFLPRHDDDSNDTVHIETNVKSNWEEENSNNINAGSSDTGENFSNESSCKRVCPDVEGASADEHSPMDETDMFCSHIAAELRQLPAKLRRTAKFQISQILYQCQMEAGQANEMLEIDEEHSDD